MSLSLITLALARKYAKEVAEESSRIAIDEAVEQAVAQSKIYTDNLVSKIYSFNIEIVDELPTHDISTHTIYFVKRATPSGSEDFYYEYLYINSKWELIGSTELDLSNYWTIDQVKEYVQSKEYVLPQATETVLGGVKINGDSIQISTDGVISLNDNYVENWLDARLVTLEDIDSLFDEENIE